MSTKITTPELFNLSSNNTAATQLPVFTTSARPTSGSSGEMIFNSTTEKVEYWDGSKWNMIKDEVADQYNSSLIMNLDPNNSASYSGSGSTITDISGSATTYNGTLTGSFVSGSPSYFSLGTTNRITTTLGLTESSGYTISVFVFDTAGAGPEIAKRRQLYGTTSAAGNGGIFMMGGNITSGINPDKESIYFYQYDTPSNSNYIFSYAAGGEGLYNDSAWHSIQFSVSSSSQKLVVDGSEITWNNDAGGSLDIDFANLRFGGASNNSDTFSPPTVDRIGAMRVYSQALTVSEMQADYNIDCATYGLTAV